MQPNERATSTKSLLSCRFQRESSIWIVSRHCKYYNIRTILVVSFVSSFYRTCEYANVTLVNNTRYIVSVYRLNATIM